MIPRYARPKIEKIWSNKNKFSIWTRIECLIAEKLSINGVIPKKAAKEIKDKAKFSVKEIELIEKETKHDFIAYINNVSSYIGESAKYFHHGVTSSDIIDTSFSVQLRQSANIIIKELELLLKEIKIKAFKYKTTIMIGRSHGVHAEPITFGLKLASFYCEFKRNLNRIKLAKDEISICSISGPVGTYNSIDPDIEKYVNFYSKKLNDLEIDAFNRRYPTGCSAIRNITQNYFHFSTWDFEELKRCLEEIGFKDIKKMEFGVSQDEKLNIDLKDRAWETVYVDAKK